jgi:hypothetical protein
MMTLWQSIHPLISLSNNFSGSGSERVVGSIINSESKVINPERGICFSTQTRRYPNFKSFYPEHVCQHLVGAFPHLVSDNCFAELMPLAVAAPRLIPPASSSDVIGALTPTKSLPDAAGVARPVRTAWLCVSFKSFPHRRKEKHAYLSVRLCGKLPFDLKGYKPLALASLCRGPIAG